MNDFNTIENLFVDLKHINDNLFVIEDYFRNNEDTGLNNNTIANSLACIDEALRNKLSLLEKAIYSYDDYMKGANKR